MTAGAGILHDELSTERIWRHGGTMHGARLWVNVPATLKFTPRFDAALNEGDPASTTDLFDDDVVVHAHPGHPAVGVFRGKTTRPAARLCAAATRDRTRVLSLCDPPYR